MKESTPWIEEFSSPPVKVWNDINPLIRKIEREAWLAVIKDMDIARRREYPTNSGSNNLHEEKDMVEKLKQ